MTEKNKPSNFQTIFLVAFTCVLIGGFIGAITNMINGVVSPYYFKAIMYWDFQNIWIASVAQGILEGLLYGVIFSVIFTTGFGLVTKGQASYGFALIQLMKIIAIVFACWIIGGLLAMFLATLSSDFYKAHFPYTPTSKAEMLKFAWVGGSIWGGMIGGISSSILGVVVMKNSWLKQLAIKQ
jgi:prolipoprotein diacylglyceryltransferase